MLIQYLCVTDRDLSGAAFRGLIYNVFAELINRPRVAAVAINSNRPTAVEVLPMILLFP